MRTIYLNSRDPYIIGKTGESQRTALRVDVEEWYQEYPAGSGIMILVRPNKVTYPLETNLIEHEGKHYLETIVTSNETKLPGWVVITAQWYDGETLVHGRTYSGKVLTSNGTNVTDGVTETTPTWVAELIDGIQAINETAATVQEAYDNMQHAVETIDTAIQTSQQTVAQAEGYAEAAAADAASALTYKNAAAASATAAAASAEQAMDATPDGYAAFVGSMATAYSTASGYAVGDYVLKDGQLYKCVVAIDEEGESWTAAHWTAVTVAGQMGLCLHPGSTTMIINNTQAASLLPDANGAEANTIFGIGQTGLNIDNLPNGTSYHSGNLITLGFRQGNLNGKNQIYVEYSGTLYFRSYSLNTWKNWETVAKTSDITGAGFTKLVTDTMIINSTTAGELLSSDANNALPNKIYCIGASVSISNTPYSGFIGNIVCLSFRETSAVAGRMQIAVANSNRLFIRLYFGSAWTAWKEYYTEDIIYYVGPNRDNTSLVGLLKTIQTESLPCTIYIDEGTYDIFADYKANNIPSPPSDVQSYDYFDYNVFLPQNCKLIGIGNVELVWNPTTDDITEAESKTWSPLNLWYGGNTVENITIRCKNGRYCIHDDSHNAYTGFKNVYKNVRCIYTQSDSGYGFDNVCGFGFEDKCTYEFDNCLFQFVGNGNHGAFYGHEGSTGGGSIIVRNCVILGGDDNNNMAIRLQTLYNPEGATRIRTQFGGCYVQGGIRLLNGNADGQQRFDVILLKSGNPDQSSAYPNKTNPYPITVYQ